MKKKDVETSMMFSKWKFEVYEQKFEVQNKIYKQDVLSIEYASFFIDIKKIREIQVKPVVTEIKWKGGYLILWDNGKTFMLNVS